MSEKNNQYEILGLNPKQAESVVEAAFQNNSLRDLQ
jgi:hypothetical protein